MAVLPAADSPRVSQGAAAGPGGTSDPQAPAAGSTASGKPLSSAQNSPPSLVPERRVAGGHPDHSPGAGDQRPHLHRAHEFPLPGLARWGVEHGQRCEPAPPRPGSLLGGRGWGALRRPQDFSREGAEGQRPGRNRGGWGKARLVLCLHTASPKAEEVSVLHSREWLGCAQTPPSIPRKGASAPRTRENTCSSWAPGQAGNPDARSSHEAQAGAFVQMFSLPSRLPLSSYLTVSY